MATKKTTTKTKAATEEVVGTVDTVVEATDTVEETENVEETNTVEEAEPVKEVVKTVVVKEKKVFTDSDYILCRSVCSGGLNVTSQSGNLYKFKDYGSECEINYRDLVTMIRRGSDHVFLPRFIILDEDFLADFPTIQKAYGKMYTKEDLAEILKLPATQMKREIEKLPKATKDSMRNLIATQIANGKLDSISKVRVLTELFDSDFNLLSDLFVK